jgi:Cof subfamily protein (haloacid dehalogenase superfamily)
MKIVASDFDGTLFYKDKCVSQDDLDSIARWQTAGNMFGIATGRGLSLIMKRLRQFKVPFDFLVCTNGATIFDAKLQVLSSHPMPVLAMPTLLNEPIVRKSHYILFFTTREAMIYRPYEEFKNDLKELEIPEINVHDMHQLQDVIQVSLLYSTIEETMQARDILQKKFVNIFHINRNRCFIDITIDGIDKGVGLQEMLQLQHWEKEPLLTIGDDENDLPMLERFYGYTVRSAMPIIRQKVIKVYDSVGSLLDDQIELKE